MPRKALIVTYYWPPAGGPGVQRWLKFVKYLPENGVEPIVFIPENPEYPIIDSTLEQEIPKSIEIIRFPIKEPYKLAKLLSGKKTTTISKGIITDSKKQGFLEKFLLFVRGNFFIPDARKSWVKPSVKFLSKYIQEHQIEIVITTGPPHSLHLIGLNLKPFDVKWIADFRDPWTTIGYHKELKLMSFAKKRHLDLEKKVLTRADHVIVTSDVTKEEFKNLTNQPITVITNGFDDEKLPNVQIDSKFSLAHIGSLLSKRNPETLWRILKDLTDNLDGFSNHLQLNLVGQVSESVLKSIDDIGLTNYLNNYGYVNHNESIMFQRKSQILLLFEINSEATKAIIPGKLFEYMASGRPILAIGPQGSDVERIVIQTNTGSYFYYDDEEKIRSYILSCYREFLEGKLRSHGIGVQKYHRKELTKSLAKLL